MNFGEQLCDELVCRGYTHCLFLAGGNVMHLVEACRTRFQMVPVVHEVTAAIGAEYFNEVAGPGRRAFALVTAGPGLTNAVTGIAGAWLESRELLVIGGQVKSADLARNGVRQLGIQEIDGVSLVKPLTKESVRIEQPVPMSVIRSVLDAGRSGRPGPVFLEICLDAQAAPIVDATTTPEAPSVPRGTSMPTNWTDALEGLRAARRPLILLGGGVSRATARKLQPRLERLGIPTALTWNGLDRLPTTSPIYAGRPNTWGMRWANVVIQQCDYLLAIGSRLGLQQTGFAWEDFAPLADIAQVDVDPAELTKGRPDVRWRIHADADAALESLVDDIEPYDSWTAWGEFVQMVRAELPLVEDSNLGHDGIVPQSFVADLSQCMAIGDVLVPSSSGGAFTVAMQVFENKDEQVVVGNKALASMGYGLAGAIGACLALPTARVVLTEGDGGFAQNLQELGTVALRGLNMKIFVMSNRGYASIRMTQRNYYNGAYVGCDTQTGLGLPDFERLASVWDIPYRRLSPGWIVDPGFHELFDAYGPVLFEVPVSQEQSYWPKIGSRVTADGSMVSAPLHLMSPNLTEETTVKVMPYILDREAQG